MRAVEPPSLLEFRRGTGTIRLEVVPEGQGSTLTLLDTLDERGKAARDAAGWHVCPDALEQRLAGEQESPEPGEAWRTLHARCIGRFGPPQGRG